MENTKPFNFHNIFIFEMANNHQGSVAHGKKIINAMGGITDRFGIRAAVKLQFRELDTFIHPAHKESKVNKHIPRFLSTRLSETQFSELVTETKKRGMITMATPFDEPSVDALVRLGIEVIKVGSCSVLDWPLLQKIAETGKPVIVSVGGLRIKEIDRVVSFFEHRGVSFALLHCVAIYPTPTDKMHLNQIRLFRHRYPKLTVGFSTHEDPNNTAIIGLAYAKGARIFEKHVGVSTPEIKLNAYSANPEQVAAWVSAWREAVSACGGEEEREITVQEQKDLHSLKRGVYLKKPVKNGAVINREDVFFAMPIGDGQLASGEWTDGVTADRDYRENEALPAALLPKLTSKKNIIYSTIHAVKGMLNESRIPLSHEFYVELSHHYGLERFHERGCTIIECINREYAKKLLVLLPGQWHPLHYHKKKDESFQMLAGELEVEIEDRRRTLLPGETLWVPRGVWHAFGTKTGAIFEEISTQSFNDDSFYTDKDIAALPREGRKTRLHNWGRHQFDDFEEETGTRT